MKIDPDVLTARCEQALAAARQVLAAVGTPDLHRPTPCTQWDLAALLGHVLGQNHGFATALATGDADHGAYAPRPVERAEELLPAWDASAEPLRTAWAGCAPGRAVHLAEFDVTLPAATVATMHVVDTVVHTWDVAAGLGLDHRPAPELVDLVATVAAQVPDDASRTAPGAAFGPAVPAPGGDPWTATLAHLGRSPHARSGLPA